VLTWASRTVTSYMSSRRSSSSSSCRSTSSSRVIVAPVVTHPHCTMYQRHSSQQQYVCYRVRSLFLYDLVSSSCSCMAIEMECIYRLTTAISCYDIVSLHSVVQQSSATMHRRHACELYARYIFCYVPYVARSVAYAL
jgi:hypothetical protein